MGSYDIRVSGHDVNRSPERRARLLPPSWQGMIPPPTSNAYRIVLAVPESAHQVQSVVDQALLEHLEPQVTPSGLHASVTVIARGRSQHEAEGDAVIALENALGRRVRVILTVSL